MDFGRENATTEFVDGMEDLGDALRSMTAILNRYPCAHIYVGVGSDGSVLGKEFSEDDLHTIRIKMKTSLNTVPEADVSILKDEAGRQYIRIFAKGGDPPYSYGGWFHVRRCRIVREHNGSVREEWRDSLTCAMKRH